MTTIMRARVREVGNVTLNVSETAVPIPTPSKFSSFFHQLLNGLASIPVKAREFRVIVNMILLLIFLLLILLLCITIPGRMRNMEGNVSSSADAMSVRYEGNKDTFRFVSETSTNASGTITTLELSISLGGPESNVTTVNSMAHDTWFRLVEEGLTHGDGMNRSRYYPAITSDKNITTHM